MFIGSNEISSTKEEGDFTVVTYKDKTIDKFSKEQLEYYQTEEALDLAEFKQKRISFLEVSIKKVLLKHNVNLQDLQTFCQMFPVYLQDDLNHKITKLFGKEDELAQPKPLGEKLNLWEIYE